MSGENQEINAEAHKQALLEKINQELLKLGSIYHWEEWPENLEDDAILKGKTIVMVDDMKEVLENFVPALTVATDGKANFIHYQEQGLENLLKEIFAHNPDLVILDNDLGKKLKGTEVLRALQTAGFKGETIGFTKDGGTAIEFKDMGAIGCLKKDMATLWQPERSLKSIADLLTKKPEENMD